MSFDDKDKLKKLDASDQEGNVPSDGSFMTKRLREIEMFNYYNDN